jgi:hypothetical protein
MMITEAISPVPIRNSFYGEAPQQRAADLPGICSIGVRDLFPDIPQQIWSYNQDVSPVRRATEAALAQVDMSRIQPGHKVNLICSEHGFIILGGEAYAEMLRTIKDVVRERTGCEDIRLRIAIGFGKKESGEIIRHYRLDESFGGRVAGINPFDKGVPIETEIGTLYGIKKGYDADRFIYAHFNDPTRGYSHRMMDRALKPFAMNYASMATRSVYHFSFGNRSANYLQRAIFNSPFIQEKYTFGCFLMTSPAGITGVDAFNEVDPFEQKMARTTFKSYGKLMRLFSEIKDCMAIVDGIKWFYYVNAGGLSAYDLLYGGLDPYDLKIPFSMAQTNPAVKALIFNHMWTNLHCAHVPASVPSIVVGHALTDRLIGDSINHDFMNHAVTAENLVTAVNFARRISNTENIIVFDGSFGHINLSRELAEFLMEKAPAASRRVDEELLPMWLKQRGMYPEATC